MSSLRAGTLVVLLLLGLILVSDARSFVDSTTTLSEQVSNKEEVCTLCEEYVTDALTYLEKNVTQAEIIDDLHERCSQLRGFAKQQCVTLVDYYVPLFFLQLKSFQPHYFCKRLNLCGKVVALVEDVRQDSCGVCHRTVSEILIKLQDPDTQLDIVELLLKGCKSFKNYAKKCKTLVFEYGPLILVNAEEFLVKNDICTLLRACPAEKSVLRQPVLADS
ncbi:PREDICTED: proactivator polypeptide-like 1 isoform X1 [Camelina sativa]|uniref:Proactivator polypeptide-like 1 isoform X1 n=1 Tax=Camelina sativa TaxID=90675 RepID=A0ABM1QE75_CAMSA|nr:PREDICTED: proactivator polypeptide-like 1 isoform X1 [Camelina sativa]